MSLKEETDSDGNGVEPGTDKMPAWIGVPVDEMEQDSPPPESTGEASPDFDQRTGVQKWGQKTVCRAWLWVLNGTWVEAAEADTQECMTFCSHVTDWHSLRISALFCGCRMDYHTHVIFRVCH